MHRSPHNNVHKLSSNHTEVCINTQQKKNDTQTGLHQRSEMGERTVDGGLGYKRADDKLCGWF